MEDMDNEGPGDPHIAYDDERVAVPAGHVVEVSNDGKFWMQLEGEGVWLVAPYRLWRLVKIRTEG